MIQIIPFPTITLALFIVRFVLQFNSLKALWLIVGQKLLLGKIRNNNLFK